LKQYEESFDCQKVNKKNATYAGSKLSHIFELAVIF
jgi:hypothetical protein